MGDIDQRFRDYMKGSLLNCFDVKPSVFRPRDHRMTERVYYYLLSIPLHDTFEVRRVVQSLDTSQQVTRREKNFKSQPY